MLEKRFTVSGVYKILDALEVYQTVLENKKYKYPFFFWEYCIREERVAIIRYFIKDILKWDDKTLFKNLDNYVFKEYKLERMLLVHYNNNFFKAINDAWPGKYKPWQFSKNPIEKSTERTAVEATRWHIEKQLKMSTGQVYKRLCSDDFEKNNLGSMLRTVFEGSIPIAVQKAFPEKHFKSCLFLTYLKSSK